MVDAAIEPSRVAVSIRRRVWARQAVRPFLRVFRSVAAAFFSGTFFMLWRNGFHKVDNRPGLATGCGAAVISRPYSA